MLKPSKRTLSSSFARSVKKLSIARLALLSCVRFLFHARIRACIQLVSKASFAINKLCKYSARGSEKENKSRAINIFLLVSRSPKKLSKNLQSLRSQEKACGRRFPPCFQHRVTKEPTATNTRFHSRSPKSTRCTINST